MANPVAAHVLEQCLAGHPWSREDVNAIRTDESLIRVVAEGLADRFDPRLCDIYTDMFAWVLGQEARDLNEKDLVDRYRRVRRPRPYPAKNPDAVRDVYVLSRVTLGADIAVTSVLIDGAKRRFRNATIWLVGDRKSYELFEGDSRVGFYPMPFKRGAPLYVNLMERLYVKSGIVLDPDSRISQLGLLPICPEENYYFFESRAYGADTTDALPVLAARWMREIFGVDPKAYIDPTRKVRPGKFITVSLGVGENPAKRLDDAFERGLLEKLAKRGLPIILDRGPGGEEAERAERAAAGLAGVELHRGSFGHFADLIRQNALYAGYDSAGSHAAAASGVSLMVFFKGAVSERFFQRWKPAGTGSMDVIRIDDGPVDTQALLGMID
ncbi:MAG: hypothetical protein K2X03_31365 [Bryobacteraceae bacterium]|nr:hypothetical protein [Bryobacteraceae bacterium]